MARQKEFNTERVLERAKDLFWRQGYAATSVQDLVEALGIGRGSLYDTFGDKHSLYLAALERFQATGNEQMQAALAQPASVREAIAAWLTDIAHTIVRDPAQRGCFVVNSVVECAPHDEAIAERTRQALQGMEDTLYAALERGKQQGEIAPAHDTRQLARVLLNTVLGLRVLAKTGPDQVLVDDIVAGVLQLLD